MKRAIVILESTLMLSPLVIILWIDGTIGKLWYHVKMFFARKENGINYDRLRFERRKYDAGYYDDDTIAHGE